jgi:hypothetical protein
MQSSKQENSGAQFWRWKKSFVALLFLRSPAAFSGPPNPSEEENKCRGNNTIQFEPRRQAKASNQALGLFIAE